MSPKRLTFMEADCAPLANALARRGGILGEDAHVRVLPEQLDGRGVDLVGVGLKEDRGGVRGVPLPRPLELPGDTVDHLQGFPGDEHPLRVRQAGGKDDQEGREQQDPFRLAWLWMHGAPPCVHPPVHRAELTVGGRLRWRVL